jgi:excisionase family DNA binding protein
MRKISIPLNLKPDFAGTVEPTLEPQGSAEGLGIRDRSVGLLSRRQRPRNVFERIMMQALYKSYSYEMTPEPSAAFFGGPGASSVFRASRVRTRFLATKAAAEYLGVSVWTLRNHVHEGRLSYIPGGKWRFDREDLDRFAAMAKEKEQVL